MNMYQKEKQDRKKKKIIVVKRVFLRLRSTGTQVTWPKQENK